MIHRLLQLYIIRLIGILKRLYPVTFSLYNEDEAISIIEKSDIKPVEIEEAAL